MSAENVVFLSPPAKEDAAIALRTVLSEHYRSEARLAHLLQDFTISMARELEVRSRSLEKIRKLTASLEEAYGRQSPVLANSLR